MTNFFLVPNSTIQWYKLILEAQSYANISLDSEIENYLINLLQQYLTNTELTNNIVSLDFLNNLNNNIMNDNKLRDTADKCLVLTGLFPGYADKRKLSLDYFVNMGQSSYFYLSVTQAKDLRELYESLSENFSSLSTVLNAIERIKRDTKDKLESEMHEDGEIIISNDKLYN